MEISHSLLLLILVLAAAKMGGEIAAYFGQSAIMGELLIGMGLGLTPLRAAASDPAIVLVASIGVILLLFEVGLESELDEFVKVGKSATLVAVIGVIIPLASGLALVALIRGNFLEALFLGATLTATSVGITARVLSDLHKTDSNEARVILGAAIIDDILGLLLLSVVLSLASSGTINLLQTGRTLAEAILFLIAAVWIGLRYAPPLINLAQKLRTRGVLVSVAFIFCLALAFAAEALGLAAIIGAFAAGLILATTDDRVRIQQQIKPLADIFIPVFFVLVGLRVKLTELNPLDPAQRGLLLLGILLVVLAILGKLAAGLGVTDRTINKLAVGVAMVPRGEVGLIFASIGLDRQIIPADIYGVLVGVVLITTLITPPWLRRIFTREPS